MSHGIILYKDDNWKDPDKMILGVKDGPFGTEYTPEEKVAFLELLESDILEITQIMFDDLSRDRYLGEDFSELVERYNKSRKSRNTDTGYLE